MGTSPCPDGDYVRELEGNTTITDATTETETQTNDNQNVLPVSDNDDVIRLSDNSLIWVKAVLNNNQTKPSMIDSGANPNCISMRCVQGSSHLRHLERSLYSGKRIFDAKGDLIEPNFVIKCSLSLGTPKLTIDTEFVVVETLPFSCIIGQKTLKVFETWEVSNVNKILTINKNYVVPFYNDEHSMGSQTIDILTTNKTVIPPYTAAIINVRAN